MTFQSKEPPPSDSPDDEQARIGLHRPFGAKLKLIAGRTLAMLCLIMLVVAERMRASSAKERIDISEYRSTNQLQNDAPVAQLASFPLPDSRSPQTEQAQKPMIARTVSFSIVVKDFAAARLALEAILARHGGYSAELTVNAGQNASRSLQGSLRIPAPELIGAVAELKSLGTVEAESQKEKR